MAVDFKTPDGYGYSLLPLFGVDQNIIANAKSKGIEITQSSPGTFAVKSGEEFFGSVTVKGSAISMAKSGGLGPASKQALKYNFEAVLNKAINKVAGSPAQEVVKTADLSTFYEEESLLSGSKEKAEPVAAPAPAMNLNVSKIMHKPPVKLYSATECYQPVFGTSNGSTYYVVAVFAGMSVAMRYKNSKASFRAEGPKLKGFKSALDDLGFSTKDDYASVHFDIGNTALLLKTVGAIVGRLGITGVAAVADPLAIAGGA